MKSKVNDYWNKTASLRASLPNLVRPKNVFRSDTQESQEEIVDDFADRDKSLTDRINQNLLKYKEIKLVYEKSGIPPAYLLYFLVFCLFFIFIGFFETYLTHLIATLYPMYISIKTLQNEESTRDDNTQWLTYWVVYAFFINIESFVGPILQFIPFYFFIKVIFLVVLFLPQYNGAKWIYDAILKRIFNKYENHIYDISKKVVQTISNSNKDSSELESERKSNPKSL